MTIDVCYEALIKKLTNQNKITDTSLKLLSLKTNNDRVLYVYDIIKSLSSFPTIPKVEKQYNVSTHYRNQGNACYKQSADLKALQYYNLSLLHAPLNSENYVLAMANRSAVLFSLKKYKECSDNIDLVFSMDYPENLKEKLTKRQLSCKDMSKYDENADGPLEEIVTLRGPKNQEYLCASAKLQVVSTPEMGRHAIAKDDIKVGEVLAQEDPYFPLLLKSQSLFSCSYCLSRNLNLIPCDHCCFALYCNDECKKKAWKEYHAVECPLMAVLIHLDFTKLELLALRIVIKARRDHVSWDDLIKTIEEADARVDTELHGHVQVDGKWVYDSKYYSSIHTLATNVEKRSVSDIFQKAMTAAVFLYLLRSNTDFMDAPIERERVKIVNCVAGLLLLHVMTSPTNMHGIRTNIQSISGECVDEVSLASAPYAFHSLLNHSCSPNVVRFSRLGSGQMSLFCLRPIKKGMQIFDNYGSHHALQDRATRHQALKFQYKFTCLCEACVNDWPTYFRLRPARNLPLPIQRRKENILTMDAIERLKKGDKGTALQLYKPLCEMAEDLEPYAPCTELADCQETLKQCLAILEGTLPYGYDDTIDWPSIPPNF